MADEMILVEFQHSKQNARLNDGGNQRMPTLGLGDLSLCGHVVRSVKREKKCPIFSRSHGRVQNRRNAYYTESKWGDHANPTLSQNLP